MTSNVKAKGLAWAHRNQRVNPKRLIVRLADYFWGGFPVGYLPKSFFISSFDQKLDFDQKAQKN